MNSVRHPGSTRQDSVQMGGAALSEHPGSPGQYGISIVPHEKNRMLEGLRGLACLNVVIAHFMFTFMPYASRFLYPEGEIVQRFPIEQWLAKPYFSVFYNGTFPVSIFFVMSGWVLTAPFVAQGASRSPMRAALKRYPRLVLPAATAILLAWLLYRAGAMGTSRAIEVGFAGWLRDNYAHDVPLFPGLLMNMFVGAPVNGEASWNTPLWTLRIELLAPLLIFALIALFGARRPLFISLVYAAIALNIFPQNGAAMHLFAFLAGYLLCFATPYLRERHFVAGLVFALGLLLGAFDYSHHFAPLVAMKLPDLSPYAWNLAGDRKTLFHTIGAILTVAGVLSGAPFLASLGARPLVWLGKVSFSAYLLHWPIVCSFAIAAVAAGRGAGFSYPQAVLLAGLAYVPLVYACAAVFERFVDAPAIRFSNWLARRAGVEPAGHPPKSAVIPPPASAPTLPIQA
jgi:peptidoglycan/LPS O-acetylase OafA/YrhL